MSEQEKPYWSQGILYDGAAILRDGVMVPIDEVISILNQQAAELKALREFASDIFKDSVHDDQQQLAYYVRHHGLVDVNDEPTPLLTGVKE